MQSREAKPRRLMTMRILFAAAALMALAAPVHASEEDQPRVLAVFAHPDDEVVVAPLLARMAREGASVSVIYATSGDQGTGVSELEAGDALAALREGEARCAARELGRSEEHTSELKSLMRLSY